MEVNVVSDPTYAFARQCAAPVRHIEFKLAEVASILNRTNRQVNAASAKRALEQLIVI